MAILKTRVKLYLESNSKDWENEKRNLLLQNDSDGRGDYIKSWNVSGLAEPTDEQLATFESDANDEEALNVIKNNRAEEYPSWQDQLDYIYHHGVEQWKTDMITPVKEKYPKT